MQFKNKEELLQFEKEREQYYSDWFRKTRTTIGFYKQWFLEIFHPEHRALKKKYDSYTGGWYREGNIIFTNNIACIDDSELKTGTIVCDCIGDIIGHCG